MKQPTPELCWNVEHLPKAISLQAKVDSKQSHYFLACHSPVERTQDERLKKELAEEQLYDRIMTRRTQRDFLGLIHGEAGTGKSHLIHWLKLRCEFDLHAGNIKDVVPILIRRRTGSLKDALEQLIEQLGQPFAKYLSPVKSALEKISAETAREKLANELSLEVGPRRIDRGKPPLPKLLRHLDQACKAGGFSRWLCRPGGIIDQRIKLLTEESSGYQRETPPQFTTADLKVESSFGRQTQNSGNVINLILELQDSDRLCQEAAELLNDALRDAIVEMTGLSGGNLRDIFDRIRIELQESKKTLALFIEDVTAMSELDIEVVNAVEPQDRLELCPLIAVLGLTDTGMGRLRTNQKQRASLIAGVGAAVVRNWLDDQKALSAFTARYLNAIRLSEPQVRLIATHRRNTGEDVNISKCDECPARSECHKRFGAVELNGVQIGMYPFTPQAPFHLLQHLVEDETTEIRRNQRGLLMHLLAPILGNPESLTNHEFPNERSLRLLPGDPGYWPEFQQRYCGGWDGADKDRMRLLARMWVDEVETADEAARILEPFLTPLGFQSFTRKTKAASEPPKKEQPAGKGDTPPAPPSPDPQPAAKPVKSEPDKVKKIRDNLRAWLDEKDKPLAKNAELRQLVADFVRTSVRWDDERSPPTSEWRRLFGGADDKQKYKVIYIEDQGADPATAPFVIRDEFPKTEETREFLEALVRFRHEGDGSWDFAGGELHKRVVARWLRKHEPTLLTRLEPESGLNTETPINAAVQFLCMAAAVRRRSKLPTELTELLEELLIDLWPEENAPVALSKGWHGLLEDMRKRHKDVREFIINELAVTQGRSGGAHFINPLPILDAAAKFAKEVSIEALSTDYFKSYWKTRYVALNGVQAYGNLLEILEKERDEVRKLVDEAVSALKTFGYETSNVREAIKAFCSDLSELKKVKTETKFYLPDEAFDALFSRETFGAEAVQWGQVLEAGRKASESKSHLDILVYEPKVLRDAIAAVRVAETHLKRLQTELKDEDAHQSVEGDPLKLQATLLDALDSLAGLLKGKEEPEHAVTD